MSTLSPLPSGPYFEINAYRARAQIGCAPEEHGVTQEVVVDLRVHLVPHPALYLDSYQMSYDYMAAVEAIEATVREGHHILQESMALKIGRRILSSEQIACVDVRLRKTERYDDVDSIGFFTPVDRELLAQVDAWERDARR